MIAPGRKIAQGAAFRLAFTLMPFFLIAQPAPAHVLTELTIEELSNIEVSSVSRRPESLAVAAASIYVITGEQIRRSGAVTLPEALRLAPNLQVARTDAREYAISARGFQSGTANKLLVLIDGRTVYCAASSSRRRAAMRQRLSATVSRATSRGSRPGEAGR
ncbi:MAG TPA: Plug domain-containing protein [Gammaproteobacteria bacterium]|nr:Plug domain-containing protein [Gammaproteobacteria bacterium]